MPSDSQEINIDVNSNDSDNAKGNERNDNSPGGGYPAERERVNVNGRNDNSPHGDYQAEPEPAMVNERDDSSPDITIIKEGDDASPESVYPAEKEPPVAPDGLTADQKQAFDMRDFLKQPPQVPAESGLSPLHQTLPYIDEPVGSERLSDEESPMYRNTEDMLNNAACRLRRWRAASRKLRRPRIINNLGDKGVCGGGRTDLADRLAAGAGAELASLAPPPPAATAPPSPGCMLSPTLADQSAADYFGSSPECYADTIGFENNAGAGAPAPPPGPRYKLATEGALRVCCFLHTRTVVDKILAAKFLRRWETHVLCLLEDHIVSKTPSGLLEKSLSYSLMQEVYCISRWDLARKYCLRIVMPHGSLLLQANDAYTRDQWYHSIIWRRNMIRYKNFLTKSIRKEVAIKELKNMVDFVMTTPLQDEIVTRAPMKLLTDLLAEEKDAPDWEEWAETATSAAAPLLAERCASGELCALLARLCKQRPRAAPLPALAPPVRRVLTRNVDFARAPNARQLVKDYISALSAHNSGSSLVRRFVEVTHGSRATCPHPRAAPNLAAVALAAIDDYYRFTPLPHQCKDDEDEVLCFADILEHMCEYEDWLITVSGVLQPVPLCPGAMACPRVATRLAQVLSAMMRDRRCAAHGGLAPAHALRPSPPSWLKAAAPSDPAIAMPHKELCRLWGNMLGSLLDCCCKRKSFLQSMSKQLPDFLLVALTEHGSAIEALCLMLEWEVGSGEQTQLEIIAALKGTCLGYQCYQDLCTKQQNLLKLQSEGGPRRLALPVRATDADVAALLRCGALGNLECLSLAFTSVTCACAHSLIQLPSLRYLNLWATQFGDRGLLLLAEHLPRLQVLNLCETRVSDRGIEALAGLPSLRRLNLNSTKLSAEAFANLRQKLPQLQEYDVRYTEAW